MQALSKTLLQGIGRFQVGQRVFAEAYVSPWEPGVIERLYTIERNEDEPPYVRRIHQAEIRMDDGALWHRSLLDEVRTEEEQSALLLTR